MIQLLFEDRFRKVFMFKKINFLVDEVQVSNSAFAKAINSNQEFGIGANGDIDFSFKKDKAYIFKGKANIFNKLEPLGKGYKIKATFVTVTISFNNIWNRVLEMNRDEAMYEDSASDGIDEFKDSALEDIGWHGIEFKISYRDMVDLLEEKCVGTIIAIEQNEPYMFNGLGFIDKDNIVEARELLFDFVKSKIIEQVSKEKDEFKKYGFSQEQKDSMEFFKIDIEI